MPKEKSRRKPAVPIELSITREEAESRGAVLMSCKEAAFEIGVSKAMVVYWASRGYLTKYYVFGNKYNYEVDLNEVELQPELGYERKRVLYNTDWASIPRDAKGAKWVKKSEASRGV
jgi:hypothetical protein